MAAPTVRAIGAGDANGLRQLRLRALADSPEAFGSSLEAELALTESDWADLARRSESADEMAVFVAVDGERWVGMAAGRWSDRDQLVAALWGMWVDPAARGGGLGARLVAAVHEWAARQGARTLRLGAVTGDGDPGAFYERLGFRATGETGVLRRDPTRSFRFMARRV